MAGYLFFPENDASHLGSRETQADLSQDLEGSGEQEGELALNYGALESEGEDAVASSYQDAFEDEGAMESDPAALDKDLQCPKEEDTVQLPGSPGCKTCRFLVVRTPRKFWNAQVNGREATMGDQVEETRVEPTFCSLSFGLMALQAEYASESPRSLVKTQISGPHLLNF